MSDVFVRRVLDAGGSGTLATQLNGPAAWALKGGSNAALVRSSVGDVHVLSAGDLGLTVQAGTGFVGVHQTAPSVALDVSGGVRAASYVDASGVALITSAMVRWTDGTVAFGDDAGGALSFGGGGSLTCRYFWMGTMVNAEVRMVLGTGASLGTNARAWTWTLPVQAATSSQDAAVGLAVLKSASAGTYTATVMSLPAGSLSNGLNGSVKVVLPGYGYGATVDAPFAWGAGDSLSMTLSYEASAFVAPSYATPVAFLQSGTSSNTLGLGLSPASTLPAGSLVVGGNVGVGMSSPAYAVDVSGGIRVTGTFTASNVNVLGGLAIMGGIETVNVYETHSSNVVINNMGTGPALVVTQAEGGLLGAQSVASFSAGINMALLIDNAGRVMVGKSASAANVALDVSGHAAVSGQVTCSNMMAGNVGIGKSSTSNYALDVSGSMNISGAATVASIAAVTHTGTNMELTGTTQTSNLVVTGMSTFTSNVGVGKAPIAGGAVFDVSGNINASGLIGCISNSVTTTSSTIAASATAVKAANDLAALALPKSGGAVTGSLAVNKPSVTGTYALDVSGSVAVSGDIFCNNNKYLKATNGYAALPGGILIQWGFNNCTSTSTTVNFPISFSSAPYSITATVSDPGYGSGTATSVVGIQNWGAPTSTLFYIGFKPMSGSSFAATNVNWMAIGPV